MADPGQDEHLCEKSAINPGRGRKRGDTLDQFKNDDLELRYEESKLEKTRSASPIEVKVISDLDRPVLKLKPNAPDSINASIACMSTLLLTIM